MKKINSIDDYTKRIKRVLVTEEEIKQAIAKAGKEIDDLFCWSAYSRELSYFWRTYAAQSLFHARSLLCAQRAITTERSPRATSR